MWKRHRALNALAGHNISTVHMDHTGVPHLLEMPAAARHRGEVCHLVNERGQTEKRGEERARQPRVSLVHSRGGKSAEAEAGEAETHKVAQTGIRCLWDFKGHFTLENSVFWLSAWRNAETQEYYCCLQQTNVRYSCK